MPQASPLPGFSAPRPLTSGPGTDLRANWTPDSGAVVFERLDTDGTRRLYRVLRDGHAEIPLPESVNAPGSDTTGRPAFIGDRMVFVSDRSGQEALYSLSGERVTPLTRAARPCYGPAALSGGVLLWFQDGDDGRPHLWGSTPDGAQARLLTTADDEQNQPWPLPGDEQMVYHARQDGHDHLMIGPVGHEAQARSLSPREGEGTPYITPFPSPDGAWIAFASVSGGQRQVWIVRPDGSGRTQITGGEPHCFPAWSPDGRTLLVVRGDPVNQEAPSGRLYLLDVLQP